MADFQIAHMCALLGTVGERGGGFKTGPPARFRTYRAVAIDEAFGP